MPAKRLFSSGHCHAFDELSLEDQVQHDHRQHCQKGACHQHRIVGAELSVQAGKPGRQCGGIDICIYDQRPLANAYPAMEQKATAQTTRTTIIRIVLIYSFPKGRRSVTFANESIFQFDGRIVGGIRIRLLSTCVSTSSDMRKMTRCLPMGRISVPIICSIM